MTQLQKLMDDGYTVMTSEMIDPDRVFYIHDEAQSDETLGTLVVHPLNYSYLAYEDPFEAHAKNMERIYSDIETSAEKAYSRLNRMVDEMNKKNAPRVVTFMPNVEVAENEDGSFSFNSVSEVFNNFLDGAKLWEDLEKEKYAG